MDLDLNKIAHKALDYMCFIPNCNENNLLNIKVLQVAIPIIIAGAAIAIARHKLSHKAHPKTQKNWKTGIQDGLEKIKHNTEKGAAKLKEGFKGVGKETKDNFGKLINH